MNSVIKASGLLVNLEQRLEKGAAGFFSPRFLLLWWKGGMPWVHGGIHGILPV